MKRFYKILSFLLIICMTITLLSGVMLVPANAEDSVDLNLDGDKNENNEYLITEDSVTLKWRQVPGASSYVISREDLGAAGDITVTGATYTITGLSSNHIYHFTVQAKDNIGNTITVNDNEINVLTGDMDFACMDISEEAALGSESGLNPGLKFQWSIPKMWDGADFSTIDADKIDYLVSVGTDKAATNLGNYNVYYDGGVSPDGYDVVKQGIPDVSMLINDADITNGVFSYEWWRYKDFDAGEINDDSLKPGTVYYIKLYPQFNTTLSNSNNVSIGKTISRVSSLADGYVATPLHVLVGKDGNNNITCTIHRINYDSKDGTKVINFKYEVYSSPDSGMISPVLEGYEFEQYGDLTKPIEIFLPYKFETSTNYYKIYAKSDNYDNIESSILKYTISEDEGKPPIPQNVTAIDTEYINNGTDEGASVSIKWDKPTGFDNDELRYYILISQNKIDTLDQKGAYYKEIVDGIPYDIRYRTVKILNESDLNFSENGYINYTLDGLNLLQDYDGFDDNYPAQLRLNKIYYIKIYSEKISNGFISDYSLPISFTTPGKPRNPPIPELFSIESVDTDEINLVWQKTHINITDYSFDVDTDYTVTYDVYIADSLDIDDDGNYSSFIFLDNYPDTPSSGINYNARRAAVTSFAGNAEVTAEFGDSVKPDATYYFMIRTRVDVDGESKPLFSGFSYVVPVTTMRGEIEEPEDDTIKPKAPVGFGVDEDSDGNPLIESNKVDLKWIQLQDNVSYRLIRTDKMIDSLAVTEDIYEFEEYTLPDDLTPDADGKYEYAIDKLQSNTIYYFSLRAERTLQDGSTVVSEWITVPVTTLMLEQPELLELEKDGTYDVYTKMKIKWRAKETYDSEIWIKSESEDDYKRWTNVTMTYDKPDELKNTDLRMNYAVLNNLTPNRRYYIKVRNSFTGEGNLTAYVSKFAGPIYSRTEFRQSDYDDEQKDNEEKAIFNFNMQGIKNSLFWILENSDDITKIKLRSARVINSMMYDNSSTMTINMGYFKRSSDEEDEDKGVSEDKEIIIPYEVLQYLNTAKETLIISTGFGQVYLKPGFIDDFNPKIAELNNLMEDDDNDIKEIYVNLKFERLGQNSSNISSSNKELLSSEVTGFSIEVMGMEKSEEKIEELINKKLTDILKVKLKNFLNKSEKYKDTQTKIDTMMDEYKAEIIEELGEFAADEVDDCIDEGPEEITQLNGPIGFKYQYYPDAGTNYYSAHLYLNKIWNRINSFADSRSNTISFDIKSTGNIAVFRNSSPLLNNSTLNNQQLINLDMKYGIASILSENNTFNGQNPITVKQLLSVIGKIIEGESDDISDISLKLELNSGFKLLANSHKITREEAAYIAMRMYAQKTGISEAVYKPKSNIIIADYKEINPSYFKAVIMAADLKIINPDENKKILPKNQINMQDTLLVITRTLTALGEL